MSVKSRIKQLPRMIYVIQDITNANASNEPETLNMLFDSSESAEYYIEWFGKPGLQAVMMCRAISVGDLQLMRTGHFNVIGHDKKIDTHAMKQFRDHTLTGVRYLEIYGRDQDQAAKTNGVNTT